MRQRSLRQELRLLVKRIDDSEYSRIDLDISSKATVAELASFLRKDEVNPELLIWSGQAALPPQANLTDAQLLQYSRIQIVDGVLATSRLAPSLTPNDRFRFVHEDGQQLSIAWPVSTTKVRLRRQETGMWLYCVDHEPADLVLHQSPENPTAVRVVNESGQYRTLCNRQEFEREIDATSGATIEGVDGDTHWQFRVLSRDDHDLTRNAYGFVPFRVKPRRTPFKSLDGKAISLRPAPTSREPELDLAEAMITLLPMVAMMLVMSVAIGFRWYYLVLIPILLFTYYYIRRRRHRKETESFVEDRERWRDEAVQAAALSRAGSQLEADHLLARYPSLSNLVRDAYERGGDLWSRSYRHEDFLSVNLSLGKHHSASKVSPSGLPQDPDARAKWLQLFDAASVTPETPIEFSLRQSHLALVGPSHLLAREAGSLLTQLVLLHSPASLEVIVLSPRAVPQYLDWLSLVPHVTRQGAWSGSRFLVGTAAVTEAMELNLVERRLDTNRASLIVIHEAAGVSPTALKALTNADPSLRIIWLGTSWGTIPEFVENWLDLSPQGAELKPRGLSLSVAPSAEETLVSVSHALAPLIDDSDPSARSLAVPDMVGVGAVVDAYGPYGIENAADNLTLSFLVDGHGAYDIDLKELGPHILVGGMSGSGKSEFLRALICSAITRYPPHEVSLIMVDYKGGSSLGDFAHTPHCVGLVSNLSEIDVDRLLRFLERELLRRQEIIAPFGGEYSKYRAKNRKKAIVPRLLIIFDEFASFVDKPKRSQTVIEIAQKGRSLGMHMVLSTQSPGGAISREIRDNVGARFALRTADQQASQAIIDETWAADIPIAAKGRVLARLGDGTVRQFQGAYTKGESLSRNTDGLAVSLASPYVGPGSKTGAREDWEEIVLRVIAAYTAAEGHHEAT